MTTSLPIVPPDGAKSNKPEHAKPQYKHRSVGLWVARSIVTPGGLWVGWLIGSHPADLWGFFEHNDKQLVALGTILLVGVTWRLAAYTAKLWGATTALASEAKASADATLTHLQESSERELRAYVLVEETPVGTDAPLFPTFASYRVVFRNSGRTPAYNTTVSWAVKYDVPDETAVTFPPIPAASKTPSRSAIGAMAATHAVIAAPNSKPLDAPTIALLRDGKLRFYIFGAITYVDAFGEGHATGFRLRRRMDSHILEACAEGNEAD